MKTLYLVRHAKSSWDNPSLSDFERPLNDRGKRDAPEIGKRLLNKGIMPELMLSSPAQRALTTCRLIAKVIGYPDQKIATDSAIYHAGESALLRIVQQTSDEYRSLMLFGHNPGFTDFANELANTDIYNIPTCGVFVCSFEVDKWQEIRFGNGQLLFFDYPKKA